MLDTLGTYSVITGFSILAVLFVLFAVGDKFQSVGESKIFKSLTNGLMYLMFAFGALFVITLLLSVFNQPSRFENCVSQAGNQVDQEAIAWVEDYCANQ